MPEKIIIICPWHSSEEEIAIPDSYTGQYYSQTLKRAIVFEGDIPCNPKNTEDKPCTLHVKIHFGPARQPWVEKITKKD